MIDEFILEAIKNVGFPIVIVLVLLYDKFRTNNNLKKAIDNNTLALTRMENYLVRRLK